MITTAEFFEEVLSTLILLSEAFAHFMEVLLGISPWMESSIIAVIASLWCYYWLLNSLFRWAVSLGHSLTRWVSKCMSGLVDLKGCSWSNPVKSAMLILEFFFTVSTFLCAGAVGLALTYAVGYLLVQWFEKVLVWQGLVSSISTNSGFS